MSRFVIITGAAGGIGSALVRHYKQAGDYVIGLTHDEVNVADGDHMWSNAMAIELQFGTPDIVIACAGTNVPVAPGDYPAMREVHETNYYGVVHTLSPYVSTMKQRGSGHLVAISSVVGQHGLPGLATYSASKAAVNAHCEAMRRELHGSGVCVTVIAPGYVDTPSTRPHTIKRPWMLSADEFAERAARAIDRKAAHAIIPWQMGLASTGLRLLPTRIVDRLLSGR